MSTRLSKLGEFGLIKRIKKTVRTDASVVKGIGDDCAVLAFDRQRYMLVTTDMLVEDVDFTARDDLALVGRKALAISLSDIAACGGTPRYALAAAGLPKRLSVEKAARLFHGLQKLADEYKVNLVGGDLSKADKLVVQTTVIGIVGKKYLALRSGARLGDAICVTGTLGGSIQGKHLRFTPRLKEAQFLVRNFPVHAMIDISDGLAQDLGHIMEASKVGAVLYGQAIPQSQQSGSIDDALTSGEEFELLFTIPADSARRLTARHKGFSVIGTIVSRNNGLLLEGPAGTKKIKARGYSHF